MVEANETMETELADDVEELEFDQETLSDYLAMVHRC